MLVGIVDLDFDSDLMFLIWTSLVLYMLCVCIV